MVTHVSHTNHMNVTDHIVFTSQINSNLKKPIVKKNTYSSIFVLKCHVVIWGTIWIFFFLKYPELKFYCEQHNNLIQ